MILADCLLMFIEGVFFIDLLQNDCKIELYSLEKDYFFIIIEGMDRVKQFISEVKDSKDAITKRSVTIRVDGEILHHVDVLAGRTNRSRSGFIADFFSAAFNDFLDESELRDELEGMFLDRIQDDMTEAYLEEMDEEIARRLREEE